MSGSPEGVCSSIPPRKGGQGSRGCLGEEVEQREVAKKPQTLTTFMGLRLTPGVGKDQTVGEMREKLISRYS